MKIRFKAEFARDWVMTRENTMGENPIHQLKECIQNIVGVTGKVKLIDSGYTDCTMLIKTTTLTYEDFERKLWQILEDRFQIGKGSKEAVISYEKLLEEEQIEAAKRTKMISEVQQNLDMLLSAVPYKQMLRDMNLLSAQIAKFGAQRVFNAKAYLFSVDDGCGLTTYLKIMADLISDLNLFEFTSSNYVIETIVEKNDKDPWLQYNAIGKFKNKMICFDISQWVNYLDDPGWKRFLRKLRNLQKDYIYVFRVPYMEEAMLERVAQSLNDAIYTEPIVFPPFTYKEYFEYVARPLAKYGFSVAQDARDEFNKKVLDEKSKGSFYGLRTIQKIAYEMMHRKMLNNARNNTYDTIIHAEDLAGWA